MRYTIAHRGVPIAEVDVDLSVELAVVGVVPLAAYDAVRPDVQAATLAMDALGFLGPVARPLRAAAAADLAAGFDPGAALARGAALGRELELRDWSGASVGVDWIELMDFAGSPPDITAWVRARAATMGVVAERPVSHPRDADAVRPDA